MINSNAIMVNSNVTTIALNGNEIKVEFGSDHSYYQITNKGDKDIYVSMSPNITPETDGVYTVSAGGSEIIGDGYPFGTFYILGTGKVYIRGKRDAMSASFKLTPKGGDNGNESKFKIVAVLPETGDSKYVYLVKKKDLLSDNVYDEYIWVNNSWETLGPAEIKAITDYSLLDNKPAIGGETVDGNKTLHDYGLPEIVESITETTDTNSLATTGAINGLIANIPTPITVDSALSETSENPVQNKVVAEALADKADKSAVVSGIKGEAETEYRGGNVNITQENLGINYWTRRKQLTPDVWYRLYEIQDPTTGVTFALTISHDYNARPSESNCLAISVDSYRKSDDLSNISIKPLTDTLKAIDSSFKKLRICEIKGNTIYIDFMPTTSTEYFTCTLSPILQSSGYDSYTIVKSDFSENPTIPDGYNVYEYDFITKTISRPADGFVKNDPNVDLSNLMTQIAHPNNYLIYDDVGKPSTMVSIPKFYLDEVIDGASHTVHPAFIINGVEQDVIYISKYQNVVENGRAYSLPMKNPQTNVTFDQAYDYCKAKGAGWHLMTNAEWAAIALWCKKNGTQPKGNNNYGKDVSETLTKAIPATKGDDGRTEKVLTGSGNEDWYHDGTYAGIADLNGNVWEWSGGLRIVNGEIRILADNDAADWNNSVSADSSAWKAIVPDGTLVTPNAADTLKYDWASNKITLSKTITTQEDAYKTTAFENLGLASGVTAPPLLKALGLYPDGTDYEGDYMYINNVDERLPLRGGSWRDGVHAGVFALNLNNARSFSTGYIGFRCAYYNPAATTAVVSEEGGETNDENRTEIIDTEQVQQTADQA